MQTDFLDRDIRYLKGVGESRAKLFNKLGVGTLGALLRYYPRAYLDLRNPVELALAPVDTPCVVSVTIAAKSPPQRTRGGRTITRVRAFDGACELLISFFNNKYTPAALEIGKSYFLYGRIGAGLTSRDMINPTVVKQQGQEGLTPVYHLTAGLNSAAVARTVTAAFALAGGELPDTLPADIREQFSLIPLDRALRSIHFPADDKELAAAKRRLAFEELLVLQLGLSLIKSRAKKRAGSCFSDIDVSEFVAALPFELTGAQTRSIAEMAADMQKKEPMSRLLQGDVGSGKTAVAAAGVYIAKKNGAQSAVMAPTEILAEQHADTLNALLSPLGVRVGLLTSSVKGRARAILLDKIRRGEVDAVVGTQAIIEPSVEFFNLAFVAADEQHRFGVEQRSRLTAKGDNPHTLVMSATPIPRTLALIIYKELDISVLDELPRGRKPVRTLLVDRSLRARYLNFVKNNSKKGDCSYIICPLIEESEALSETEAAVEYYKIIQKALDGCSVGLLHGRMKPAEKNAALMRFRDKQDTVLVSTTVVEVGMDVPDATIIIIENAERFGLSQLHQLRGRVGRSDKESFCVLVSDARNKEAYKRLKIMTTTSDGFEIAKSDLAARGPGDFLGKRQHGLPTISTALLADETAVYDAARAAERILLGDRELRAPQNAYLRTQVERMFNETPVLN